MPSYSNVFSQQFINYTDTAPIQEFEVPVGFTAVVRQVTAICELGGMVLSLGFKNDDAAPENLFYYALLESTFSYVGQEMRVVVPGGGTIILSLTALDLATAVYVGGYLLRDTVS